MRHSSCRDIYEADQPDLPTNIPSVGYAMRMSVSPGTRRSVVYDVHDSTAAISKPAGERHGQVQML